MTLRIPSRKSARSFTSHANASGRFRKKRLPNCAPVWKSAIAWRSKAPLPSRNKLDTGGEVPWNEVRTSRPERSSPSPLEERAGERRPFSCARTSSAVHADLGLRFLQTLVEISEPHQTAICSQDWLGFSLSRGERAGVRANFLQLTRDTLSSGFGFQAFLLLPLLLKLPTIF